MCGLRFRLAIEWKITSSRWMESSTSSPREKAAAQFAAKKAAQRKNAPSSFVKVLFVESKFFQLLLFFHVRDVFRAALVGVDRVVF